MLNWFSLAGLWQKLAVYAAVALVLIGLGAGTVWYVCADKLAAKSAEIDSLKEAARMLAKARAADEATLARRSASKAAIARKTASARGSLDTAQRANRPWADQPVPKEVQDALKP